MREARKVQIAHDLEMAIGQGTEVSDEVWAPVAATNHTYI